MEPRATTPSPRFHVLHAIDSLGLGGAERMLVDLANRTVADGHRVSVCVTRDDTTTLLDRLDPRIDVLVLRRRRRFSLAASLRLAAHVRLRGVDVIHAHMRSTAAFMVMLRALRFVRTPVVFHDHYGSIETDRSVPSWFRIGHRFVDHYVGVCDQLERWADDAGMDAERTTTISNALDLERLGGGEAVDLRAELGLEAGAVLGIVVATLRPAKGIEMLIEALARSRHRDTVHVAVAGAFGDAAYADLCRTRAEALGLADRVHLLGPRVDVPALLRSADFGILSSHSESGPLVLIEYLAASLPIVSTLVGDIGRSTAASGVPGFVPASDPDAFAAELDGLLDLSPAERRARGDLGRERMIAGWDIGPTMPRWYDVYARSTAVSA